MVEIGRQTEFTEDYPAVAGVPPQDRVDAFLRKLGADDRLVDAVRRRLGDVDVQDVVRRFRVFAEKNPAVLLAALSAVVVGGAAATREVVKRRSRPKTTRKKSSRSSSSKRRSTSSKRTLIEPHAGDKRYVRRDARGRIKESVNVGRSLSADRRRKSKRRAKSGEGDRGDR